MPQFSAVPSFRKVISTPMSGSIKWSSASQLTSRIHPLRFLWTSKGFISPESFLIFFPKPVYSGMVAEKFQI